MLFKFCRKVRLKLLIESAKKFGFIALGSHHVYFKDITENSTIVDIGGNKGEFLKAVKSKINCKYYFVEVDKSLFSFLPEFPKLIKSNFAISSKKENLKFYCSNNSEANSFNETIASKYGIREILEVQTETLESYSASNEIDRINLLKIDVEGAEIDILKNANKYFLQKIDQITIEFHEVYDEKLMIPTLECISILKENGFYEIVMYDNSFEDVVFLNSKRFMFSKTQFFWLKFHQLLQYKPKFKN